MDTMLTEIDLIKIDLHEYDLIVIDSDELNHSMEIDLMEIDLN